jgi:hypothetical protein
MLDRHGCACPTMIADALARDLKKMEARAFHMPEWTAVILRRYHTWDAARQHLAALKDVISWSGVEMAGLATLEASLRENNSERPADPLLT